mmetsp:Transcript_28667/g.89346  ORF Transcript_28667/g.89346 Transcript_28667/m.89346 type:complete len:430 (-) Transcript_28667:65-1354(-)
MVRAKEKPDEQVAFVNAYEASTGSTLSDSDEEPSIQCTTCGHSLASDVVFCPKCGTKREDLDRGCCRCGWRCCCCCCGYLLLNTVLLTGVVVALVLSMNIWVKAGVEEVGDAVFGTHVTIGAMNLGLAHGRASITNMTVESPPGFDGSFLGLGRFVFDLSPRSILAAWLSGWIAPVDLRELAIQNVSVLIDMNWSTSADRHTTSNAQTIVQHMNKATEPLPTPSPEEVADIGLHALSAKIKVGRVELSNISAGVLLRPFLHVPVSYEIKRVVVADIGEKSDGVYLWEFVEILSRAILMAVIRAAPGNIRANLAKVFGQTLFKDMDFKEIMYDAGEGLCKISKFSGWATGEAALLPLKFAALEARITGKTIATEARLGLKATEVGAKLTGMGIRANLAATKAAVKAGIKANEAAMKIRNAFTLGMMHAIR